MVPSAGNSRAPMGKLLRGSRRRTPRCTPRCTSRSLLDARLDADAWTFSYLLHTFSDPFIPFLTFSDVLLDVPLNSPLDVPLDARLDADALAF